MSKKKNTLKDLDEFLKQQAATLVSPARLGDQNTPDQQPENTVPEVAAHKEQNITPDEVSPDKVLAGLQSLARSQGHHFRNHLYDLIIGSLENQTQPTPEDCVLINTALYLKSGDNWKDTIREYWRKRNT